MRSIHWLAVALLMGVTPIGAAEEKPLWELGFGIGPLVSPDYRGSDEARVYYLPLPYIVYRGDILKVDRRGVYSRLYESGRVVIDLSGDAGVPVDSSKNEARRDMPDLDTSFEVGPSFEICMWRDCHGERRLQFRLPLRAMFTTDFGSVESHGGAINPHINFDMKNIGPGGGWNLGLSAGVLYATERYHDYYYEVAPQYATPARLAYDARGGYSGSRVSLSLSKRFRRTWVGAFARYDNLNGTAFEDSPLMRVGHSFMAGFGIAWIFAVSDQVVDVHE